MQCCNVRDVNDAALYVDAFQGGEEETVAHFDFYSWKVKEVQLSYRYTYVSGLPHPQYLCRINKFSSSSGRLRILRSLEITKEGTCENLSPWNDDDDDDDDDIEEEEEAVSYTHLTLPTKLSV